MLLTDALNDHGRFAKGTGVRALAEIAGGFGVGLAAGIEVSGGGVRMASVVGGWNRVNGVASIGVLIDVLHGGLERVTVLLGGLGCGMGVGF